MAATAPPPAGSPPPAWIDRLDGFLNPILVKDIRCWLRSKRFLVIFFIGLGLTQALAINFTLMASYRASIGADLFIWLMGGLGFVLGGVVPYLIQEKFAEELHNRSTELALISRMTPGMMVRGKLLSGTAASILFFAAVGPTLMLAYLLGGLDLPTVLYTIVVLLFLSILCMLAAVLLVAAGGKRRARVASFLLIGAGIALASILVGIVEGARRGRMFSEVEFWIANGYVGVGLVLGGIFFYFAATSRLSFQADNSDTRPRLALSTWTLATALSISLVPLVLELMGQPVPSSGYRETVMVGIYVALAVFGGGMLFLMNTPAALSARVRADWPRSAVVSTLFYPGRDRLGAYALAHLGLLAVAGIFTGDAERALCIAGTVFAAATALAVGMAIHRILARFWEGKGKVLPMAVVVVLVITLWTAVGVTAMVISSSAMGSYRRTEIVLAFNPVTAIGYLNDSYRDEARFFHVVGILGLPALFGFWVWFRGVGRALKEHYAIHAAAKEEMREEAEAMVEDRVVSDEAMAALEAAAGGPSGAGHAAADTADSGPLPGDVADGRGDGESAAAGAPPLVDDHRDGE